MLEIVFDYFILFFTETGTAFKQYVDKNMFGMVPEWHPLNRNLYKKKSILMSQMIILFNKEQHLFGKMKYLLYKL